MGGQYSTTAKGLVSMLSTGGVGWRNGGIFRSDSGILEIRNSGMAGMAEWDPPLFFARMKGMGYTQGMGLCIPE